MSHYRLLQLNDAAHVSRYAAWLQRAEELDAIEGRDRWRDKVESDHYDFRHALATTQRLREARERGDAPISWSTTLISERRPVPWLPPLSPLRRKCSR